MSRRERGRRGDGRRPDQLRSVTIERNYIKHAEGSALIQLGDTKVICTASVENKVPPFLKDSGGLGWVTAEYGMLPRSTHSRSIRESARGRLGGRTQEVQRLIGRSLRAVVDLEALGSRTIWIDCDVIQADGGTRTASITGACVALYDALDGLVSRRNLEAHPMKDLVAAVSAGVVGEEAYLDLSYEEDSKADVDMNLVLTGEGKIVEIQGTAEREPFSRNRLLELIGLARIGIAELIEIQRKLTEWRP